MVLLKFVIAAPCVNSGDVSCGVDVNTNELSALI